MRITSSTGLFANIDGLDGEYLHGWAYAGTMPEERLDLQIFVDGRLECKVRADLRREDLETLNHVAADCSFFVRLRPGLFNGQTRVVTILEAESQRGVASKFLVFPTLLDQVVGLDLETTPVLWGDHYSIFDKDFYIRQVGPVDDPLTHYQTEGWRSGFDPHPLFSTTYYVHHRGTIRRDPITDFLALPKGSIPEVHPLFDAADYLRKRPDVRNAGIHPLLHYLTRGWKESLSPSEFFDETFYEEQCPGLRDLGFIPIVHYLLNGWRENKRPHRDFFPDLFSQLAELSLDTEPFSFFVSYLRRRNDLAERCVQSATLVPKDIKLSIVILNLEKWMITSQCLYFLDNNTDLSNAEVILVDNGSSPSNFSKLVEYCSEAVIMRLPSNHGFGEGNNIGVERASGEYLCFLNNDVFVTPGWLPPLLNALERSPDLGATGPMFLYPDGSLQEAGAMISLDGSAVQIGKRLNPSDGLFNKSKVVDYCSAATLVMRLADFRAVLGFDLCWDPAYYEDADLCLKLRLLGKPTLFVPESKVYHVENGTSSDTSIGLRLNNIVAANRLKFVERWGSYLENSDPSSVNYLVKTSTTQGVRDRSGFAKLAIYTPYPLYPGGGERYLLSIAALTEHWCDTTLFTPEAVSQIRLATMARELSLDLSHLRLATWSQISSFEKFDFFIAMGNELLPPVPGVARSNIFHCQFPFKMDGGTLARNWPHLSQYQEVVVNSEFTMSHYVKGAQRLKLQPPPVTVLNPPVPMMRVQREPGRLAKDSILNVGRFAPGGHCKRQDVMIDAFRKLHRYCGKHVELHLVGALGQSYSDREYLLELQTRARGLPIFFHVNASPEAVNELYSDATLYWHCTGILDDIDTSPERFEHFGITIVEAMSAGLIPVVLGYAGPSEIISNGHNGFLISGAEELEAATYGVIMLPEVIKAEISSAAVARAARYSQAEFAIQLNSMLTRHQATNNAGSSTPQVD